MKYKIKTKDCRLIVNAKTQSREAIDEKELDRFSRAYMRGFLKPKLLKKNLIEYSGPVAVTLNDRLKKPLTKREFLFIMEQIVVSAQKLQANQMPIYNLIMDSNYAFINDVTKELQLLYVPLVVPNPTSNIMMFIESIVYSTKPSEDKDTDFVSRFIYFVKSMKQFDINKIEEFIAKEDRSVVNTIKKHNAGQSGFMTNKQQHYYEHYDNKNNEDDSDEATDILNEEDEATGLLDQSFEEDEATGLLSQTYEEDEATGLLSNDEDEATGLLNDDSYDEEGTALLDERTVAVHHFPSLYRVLTEETISVNKPVFRLGKEKSYVDYFVTNNIAVSRSHADIITRGSKYFVKDLNSKNHTYINDEEICVMCEIEIKNEDRLRLGNEEFIFYV